MILFVAGDLNFGAYRTGAGAVTSGSKLMNRVFRLLFVSVIFCASCTFTRAPAPERAPEARQWVDARLADATESISRDMATLVGSQQNRDFGQHVYSGDLYGKMTLEWDGPIEGALSRVASHAGFRLVVEGKEPKNPVQVHVKMVDRPCIAIFREIGMQTGPGEGVLINENARMVTLRYVAGSGGRR